MARFAALIAPASAPWTCALYLYGSLKLIETKVRREKKLASFAITSKPTRSTLNVLRGKTSFAMRSAIVVANAKPTESSSVPAIATFGGGCCCCCGEDCAAVAMVFPLNKTLKLFLFRKTYKLPALSKIMARQILFLLAIITAVILISGCAGQPSQASQGGQPAQQTQAVNSGFPSGWSIESSNAETLASIGATQTTTGYRRGSSEFLSEAKSVFNNPADAKAFYERAQASTSGTPETFSAGDGAFVVYSKPSGAEQLMVAGYKGGTFVQMFYKNTPDRTYKSKNLPAEKELMKSAMKGLLV